VGLFLTRLYGLRIRTIGIENIPEENGFLVVGNHIGYVEIVSLLTAVPVVFVAKEEVKTWPVLGPVFRIGGEVFVDRTTGGRSDEYAAAVEEALQKGINIFFAPEGTTSNGTILRRFKSPLFVPANRLKKKVLPFAVSVEKINGEPLTPENRDLVYWHSDMTFTPHFLRLLRQKNVSLVYNFGAPVIPDFDDSSLDNRREFSAYMRTIVEDLYRPLNPFYTGEME